MTATNAVDMEEMQKAIHSSMEQLGEHLEDMETALSDSIERSKKGIGGMVIETNKSVEEKLTQLDTSFSGNLDDVKKNLSYTVMTVDEMKEFMQTMDEKLAEKADKSAINMLHRRITALFSVSIAALGGSIIPLSKGY